MDDLIPISCFGPGTLDLGLRKTVSRRWFFKECGVGLGAIALKSLLERDLLAAPVEAASLAAKKPHFAGKAKNVIYLFMAGAPSHLELFDHKPQLAKFD